MQIKSDMTKEQLLNDPDPAALTCYSIEKLRLLVTLFWCVDDDEYKTGNLFNRDKIQTVCDMIDDACNEIDYIIECSNEQARKIEGERRSLRKTLEETLSFLEDPDYKPGLKTMAERIRLQLQ